MLPKEYTRLVFGKQELDPHRAFIVKGNNALVDLATLLEDQSRYFVFYVPSKQRVYSVRGWRILSYLEDTPTALQFLSKRTVYKLHVIYPLIETSTFYLGPYGKSEWSGYGESPIYTPF